MVVKFCGGKKNWAVSKGQGPAVGFGGFGGSAARAAPGFCKGGSPRTLGG